MEKERKRNEEDFYKGKISKEAKSKSVSLTAESVAILPAQSSNQLSPSSQETSKKTNLLSVFNDNPANASNNSEYRLTVVCDDDPNIASLSTSDNEEKANENNSKSATTLPQQLTSDPSSVELYPKKKESKDDNDTNKTELLEKYGKLLSEVTKTMETRGRRLFPTMWYRNASTGDWIKHTPYDNSTSTIDYFTEEEKESYRIWFKKISTEVKIAEVTEEIEIPADIDFSQLEYVRQFYPDPMPLMPVYRKYETRLKSFNILSNPCIEEIELLAKLGFYFLGCHCLGRPVLNVRSKDLEAYNYDSAACFCCGIVAPIFYKYPRPESAVHYLHCKLKLPKDKQYMKDSVIPLTKKDELDFHLKIGRTIPKCLNCCEEDWEMQYYPCQHGKFCISCAKSEPTCLQCNEIYTGLVRKPGKTVLTNASKQLLISSPPAILILHLKRFQVFRCTFKKKSREVKFPTVFDLTPYCSMKCKNSPTVNKNQNELLYSLYGVVEHMGTLHGGHYVAYVKVRAPLKPDDPRWSFLPKQGCEALSEDSDRNHRTSNGAVGGTIM